MESWWPAYEDQVLEILETVCLTRDPENETTPGDGTAGLPPSELQNGRTVPEKDSFLETMGLSLEVKEHTETGATLVFRQSGGNPAGELTFGDACFSLLFAAMP